MRAALVGEGYAGNDDTHGKSIYLILILYKILRKKERIRVVMFSDLILEDKTLSVLWRISIVQMDNLRATSIK